MRKGLGAGMMLAMLFCFSVNAATITGTVTDQSTSNPVAGATLILLSGTTPMDTVTTNASGVYTFSDVAVGSYTINVSATGYVSAVEPAAISGTNQTLTRNIALVPVSGASYGAIGGTVTDRDSLDSLSGVTITLRQGVRGTGGVVWTDLATTTSSASGWFFFDSVLVNTNQRPYSLVFAMLGYLPDTSAEIMVDSGVIDTVDMALIPGTAVVWNGSSRAANPAVSIAVNDQGTLLVRNASRSGTLSLYTASGRMVLRKNFRAGQNRIVAPGLAGNAMIAVLSGNGFRVVERLSLCR
ncbi:MAG: carboxypeptidase regulatory-like domain-containing protein [Chitinispirillaceae bacterium]|nr:carboxypeptidase regulatory-like domain-containing protein [Chitinispirillaceae bacterium]